MKTISHNWSNLAAVLIITIMIISSLLSPKVSFTQETPTNKEQYVTDQIIVKFKETALMSMQQSLNHAQGTEVIYTSKRAGYGVLQKHNGKRIVNVVSSEFWPVASIYKMLKPKDDCIINLTSFANYPAFHPDPMLSRPTIRLSLGSVYCCLIFEAIKGG